MLHLLPTEYLKEIRRNYLFRFGTVVCFLASFVFIIGICSLLPTYLWLQSELFMASIEKPKNDLPKLSVVELDNFKTTLLEKVSFLESEKNSLLTKPLEAILDGRPQGVSLTAFSFSSDPKVKDGVSYIIEVTGTASSRSELSKFIEYLKANKIFSKVDAPLSLFTKDKDIPFTIFLYD